MESKPIHPHWVRGVYYECGTQEDLIYLLEKAVKSKQLFYINYMDANYKDILEVDKGWFSVCDEPVPLIELNVNAAYPKKMCVSTARIGMMRDMDNKTVYTDPMYTMPTKREVIEKSLALSPTRRLSWCVELGIDPSILYTE